MLQLKQTETFRKWERSLKDQKARATIAPRLFRLANGLAGDVLPLEKESANCAFTTAQAIESISSSEVGKFWCFFVVESTQSRDIRSRRSSWPSGRTEMAEKLYDYDPADALQSDEAIEVFLADAFETGDARHIARALGVVARVKGMTEIARKTGLAREQLYKSLSENGNPTLETILAVLKAIGFEMTGRRNAA